MINLSAHLVENYLIFPKLTQLLSVGQIWVPLKAFKTIKQNQPCFFSTFVRPNPQDLKPDTQYLKPASFDCDVRSCDHLLLVEDSADYNNIELWILSYSHMTIWANQSWLPLGLDWAGFRKFGIVFVMKPLMTNVMSVTDFQLETQTDRNISDRHYITM